MTIAPINSAALPRAIFRYSTANATGTSSIEIEDVSDAIVISRKNASETNMPMAPMSSNNSGNTDTIRAGPATRLPSGLKISTPLASATYIAGRMSMPAITAIPISSKATRLPVTGRFSRLLI